MKKLTLTLILISFCAFMNACWKDMNTNAIVGSENEELTKNDSTNNDSSDTDDEESFEEEEEEEVAEESTWDSYDASGSAFDAGYGLGTTGAGGGGGDSYGAGGFGAGGFGPGGYGGGGNLGAKSAGPAMKSGGGGRLGNIVVSSNQVTNPIQYAGFNTDEYSTFEPNSFSNTLATPLSTFGADVDTASYSVFRNMINRGLIPLNLPLRTEEMINYFRYDYPSPSEGMPFAVTTEIVTTPWNEKTKLLQIGVQTPRKKVEMDSNLVFLIDVSGSMCGSDRLELIKNAMLQILPGMTSRDRVSIVTYASEQRLVLDGANAASERSKIANAIQSLQCGGYTEGGRGIQMAYTAAQTHFIKGGNNRIILATDGDLNVGVTSTSELTALVEEKKKSGVFLSVLGVGTGNYKDNRLESIADHGNGNYHYLDTYLEARKVLVEERDATLYTVAKDVKFQVEFNPAKIKGYRLIGYESRKLNAEDFKDDTKDGGEIGANQQVTILYELVEADADVEVAQVDKKYQKTEVVASDELLTVNIRYKEPDGDKSKELNFPVTESSIKSQMSDNLKFASAIAQVSMILNKSKFVGTATYKKVINQLNNVSGISKDVYRAEFVELVKTMSLFKEDGNNIDVNLSITSVDFNGGLNRREILLKLRYAGSSIKDLFAKEVAKGNEVNGIVNYTISVNKDGSVKKVDSRGSYNIKALNQLVIEKLKQMTFKKSDTPTTINFKIVV